MLEVHDPANCEAMLLQPPEVGGGILDLSTERCAPERFDNPTRWRSLGGEKYPEARDSWLQENTVRSRSDLPVVPRADRESACRRAETSGGDARTLRGRYQRS